MIQDLIQKWGCQRAKAVRNARRYPAAPPDFLHSSILDFARLRFAVLLSLSSEAMKVLIIDSAKCEIRSMIRFLHMKGISPWIFIVTWRKFMATSANPFNMVIYQDDPKRNVSKLKDHRPWTFWSDSWEFLRYNWNSFDWKIQELIYLDFMFFFFFYWQEQFSFANRKHICLYRYRTGQNLMIASRESVRNYS